MEKRGRIGKGNTAEVFEYGEGKVCKLFLEGYPREYVELEYANAIEVFSLNLNIPRPFEMIETVGRCGIIYEKIEGKTLLTLMLEQEEKDSRMLDELVKLHCELLSRHTTNLLSYKDFLIKLIEQRTDEEELLIDQICALPDGDCLLHGDFHPGNVLVKEDNSLVIIDFLNVCQGPAEYDIARTFFLLRGSDEAVADSYLNKMCVHKGDIAQFLNVIEQCRKYES